MRERSSFVLSLVAGVALAVGLSPAHAAVPDQISRFKIFELKLGDEASIARGKIDAIVKDMKVCGTPDPSKQDGTCRNPLADKIPEERDKQPFLPSAVRSVDVRTDSQKFCAAARTWLADADRRVDQEFRIYEDVLGRNGGDRVQSIAARDLTGKVDPTARVQYGKSGEAGGKGGADKDPDDQLCLDSITVRANLPGEWASVLRVYFAETGNGTSSKQNIDAAAQKIGNGLTQEVPGSDSYGSVPDKNDTRTVATRLVPPNLKTVATADTKSALTVYRIEWYVHWLSKDQWLMLARDRMKTRMVNEIFPPFRLTNVKLVDQGRTHRREWREAGDKNCTGPYLTFDLSYDPQMILVASLGAWEERFHERRDKWWTVHRLNQNERNSVDKLLQPATGKKTWEKESPSDTHRLPIEMGISKESKDGKTGKGKSSPPASKAAPPPGSVPGAQSSLVEPESTTESVPPGDTPVTASLPAN